MRLLLKRMHKRANRNKTEKFMTDLGITAFYEKSDKKSKNEMNQQALLDEKEKSSKQCIEKSITITNLSTKAGLLSEGSNII
ncbi:hypothetical protein CDQ84_06220 [Clostridium thermosuccinogenes]|uniref:Uncharacterized protein n=1 Tax=Clostridium thermosuccinogenes TaxID=84032 RepID=A0A2K2FHS4_9CLOT|nr:hypothetical protein [Pseudoclostridium thermosuccinogenes]AUS95859.1 hypothetical protein CDO33_05040 [Pseudoclostridium thermosuccinogenes]PNT93424.1 hypothetical protein CDQ83_07920 [Pseudoclostridium thermosuccinogenes]PNT98316.1 hypothetical protein CDQ85_05725 [Pseudoclostridium thermosuccinogenes]PNU00417.1 hypothetical protein CDQ84_06220 [Pseudoclostridium thermosuccinogenes]